MTRSIASKMHNSLDSGNEKKLLSFCNIPKVVLRRTTQVEVNRVVMTVVDTCMSIEVCRYRGVHQAQPDEADFGEQWPRYADSVRVDLIGIV